MYLPIISWHRVWYVSIRPSLRCVYILLVWSPYTYHTSSCLNIKSGRFPCLRDTIPWAWVPTVYVPYHHEILVQSNFLPPEDISQLLSGCKCTQKICFHSSKGFLLILEWVRLSRLPHFRMLDRAPVSALTSVVDILVQIPDVWISQLLAVFDQILKGRIGDQ